MKHSYVTVTDQFCGAGGSSLGAQRAGAEIRMALNHLRARPLFLASGLGKSTMLGYNYRNEIGSPGGACNTARRNTQEVVAPMCSPQHTPTPHAQQEEWRPVIGYEGLYDVSDLGRVRSLGSRARVLSQEPIKGGYLRVSLARDGYRRHHLVHCLVAPAFIGPRPNGNEVNHKDLNPGNNRASNLEYLTPKQNVRHSFAGGRRRINVGGQHHNARLTDAQAVEIRAAFAAGGVTKAEIARAHGLSTSLVGRLLNGRTYGAKAETNA